MMGKILFFLGLQISQSPRGIFINQSKYALESLKKYGFKSCDPVDTSMVEKSKLDEDKEGKAIDPSHYHDTIGTLLYLTASRPDLQFAICMCARYQARPTEKHLHAATATVHHHSIHFKMNNKKRIVNLEYFREMLHICPRIPNQTFDELPFEEEIVVFLRYLGHIKEIKKITDGMYHKKNVDFAYLMWEDFLYQIEHKDAKKSNEMYYPRFIKVIINFFMTKDPLIPRRNKSDTTMPPPMAAGTRLLTSAKGKQPAKSSKAKGLFVLSEVALTEAEQIKLARKRSLQQSHISQASESDDDDDDVDNQSEADDDQDSDNDDDDFVHPKLSTHDEEAKDEESFDLIVQTPSQVENSNDERNDNESHGMNVGGEEGPDAEDDDKELYKDVNINLEGRDVQMTDVHTTQVLADNHVTLTLVNPDGQQQSSSVVDVPVLTTVVHLLVTAKTLPPPSIPIMSQVQQAPVPTPTTTPSTFLQDLPNFGSLFGFDHCLKTLEANFSEFMQTNQFTGAVSSNPGIVDRYIDHWMHESVKVAVQLQSDRLPEEAQAKNKDFLNKLDENIQKIIKEQVKEQVKVQVSKILPKIKKTVNEQLEAKVLTRSSNSSKTSYAVATDLSGLKLKKILIEKMESNKDTIMLKRHRDDANKDEEPFAGSDRGSKRRREEKEPKSTSAPKEKESKTTGKSTEGSKSHQKTASESAPAEEPMRNTQYLEEPSHQEFETGVADDQPIISDMAKQADSRASFNEMMDTPVDFLTFLMNRLNVDTLTPELLAGPTYKLMKGSCKSLVELEFFLEEVYKVTTNQLDWNNPEGQQYPHNLLKPLPLIPNSRGRHVIPFDHFINNDLEHLHGGASSRMYTTPVTKTKAADYRHIKWIEDLTIGSLLEMSTQNVESSLSPNFRLSNSTTTSTCIGSLCIEMMTSYTSSKKATSRGFTFKALKTCCCFCNGTLNDVRNALDDRLKGIWMKYLPQTIWRRSDKERAAAMIQAIDK
uniref:Uncharacterized mitochondrial protein AtMg00810-like n=1 Tax=Tanacetum cinerariifolium TaxID=118510 RepID=A0A6L2NY78_TANCI|nr:uncharacterized mitochondrial protein AtMg00810-like [Tanacetum cinerariifolium]